VVADRFPTFDGLPVERVPWAEATEVEAIAGSDVGISWIPDDPWSRGKCGLKVLQYQASGLPVVANPVGVHPKMIEPGRTGFLPATEGAWLAAIRMLAAEPSRRRKMGVSARENVERNYSVSAWSPAFVAAVSGAGLSLTPAPKSGALIARKVESR
jgi:hypothetical protein